MSSLRASSQSLRFGERTRSLLKAWVRYPTQVASVCPSSRFLTGQLAARECIREARRVVELGPGAGGTTEALLSEMGPDAQLLSIEKTIEFAGMLDHIDDARLHVEFGDAVDLVQLASQNGFCAADSVVSGIPFSHLAPRVAERIVAGAWDLLRPGGALVAYQMRSHVKNYARPYFGRAKAETVLFNLPPLFIFEWRKPSRAERPSSTHGLGVC